MYRITCWLLIALAFLVAPQGANAADGVLELTLKESEQPGAADAQRIRLYWASKALVIGIDNYGGAGGWFGGAAKGWPKLSMAIKDAEEVAHALTAQGFAVTLLKDLGSADLKRALEDFFITEGADPEARLLVWFAGHGHTIQNEGYLVPIDAPLPKDDVEFRRKALSLRRFGEFMREARAKHVLVVFDSCFAGTIFNVARAAPPPAITKATAQPVRQFVASGEADQAVSDDGTFRRLFVDALEGKERDADANKDGYITGSELGLFLSDKVTNLTGARQTPRYGKLNALGYDRGDFVMQSHALGPPAAPAAKAQPPPPATAPPLVSDVSRAWDVAEGSNNVDVLEAFRRQFGAANPFYDQLAAARIEAVKRAQTSAKEPSAARVGKLDTGKPTEPGPKPSNGLYPFTAILTSASELRQEAREISASVRKLEVGDTLSVLGEEAFWYKVSDKAGVTGYVRKDRLKKLN